MKSIKVLFAGIVVYFAMAMLHACGSVPPTQVGTRGTGGSAATSSGGHGGGTATAGGKGGMGGMLNPVDYVEAKSGSRLKERRYVGDDGSEQFVGFYDSSRKEDCGFSVASDGMLRCMPIRAMGTSYFGDAGCVDPVGYVADPPCGGFPTGWYFIRYDTSNLCQYKTKIYEVGIELPVGTPIWSGTPMSCSSIQVSAIARVWQVGAVVDPSKFVAATVTTDP